MNFSANGVIASRVAFFVENCRDFVDVSRTTLQVGYHGKSSPVGSPETAARPTRVMRVLFLSKTTKLGMPPTLHLELRWSLRFLSLLSKAKSERTSS